MATLGGPVLGILGENSPTLVKALTRDLVNQDVLGTLRYRATWLAPKPRRDRIGHAAARYWSVQLLASTVMSSSVLDPSATYYGAVEGVMQKGAEALFEFGQSQFEELGAFALDIADWIAERRPRSLTLIESPIGNSLPVQLVHDAIQRRGLRVQSPSGMRPAMFDLRLDERPKTPPVSGQPPCRALILLFSSTRSFRADATDICCMLFKLSFRPQSFCRWLCCSTILIAKIS